MKAIVFTTDAIFALIITAAAISVLLYFRYAPQNPLVAAYSNTQSILNSLLSTHVANIANKSYVARAISYQSSGGNYTWMQYGGNGTRDGSLGFGNIAPSIEYILPTQALVNGLLVGYGNLYFAAGNRTVAVNSTFGVVVWNVSVGTAPNSIALYNNMLVYSNSTSLAARFANTGSLAWAVSTSAVPSSKILVYNNQFIYGTTGDVVNAYFAGNGTLAWQSAGLGFAPTSIAVVGGSLAVSSGSGLDLLTQAGTEIWAETSVLPTTNISTYNNVIAFGSADNACGFFVDGAEGFCYATGNAVSGVAVSSGEIIYQTSSSVIALSQGGAVLWNTAMPSAYGSPSGYPAATAAGVYTGWTGGYLAAQRLGSGSIYWKEYLPSGHPSLMALGYGRLFVVSGDNVIAYGACPSGTQSSVLYDAASLYENGYGSCATALLNGMFPISNYTVALNNSIMPGQRLAYFSGNSYINVTNSSSLYNFTSGITYSVWFDAANAVGSRGIISQGLGSGKHSAIWLSGNTLVCDLELGSGDSATANVVNSILTGTWYQASLVYNESQGNIGCYLDGRLDASSNVTVASFTTTSPLVIGDYGGNFIGSMADAQVYEGGLTSQQVESLYTGGAVAGPASNAILAWYPLDGDANDYSGLNNTGFPFNVVYKYSGYVPQSFKNAFEVTKATALLPVLTYATQFNGQSSYVITPTNNFPTGSASRSVFLWIYYPGIICTSTYLCTLESYGGSGSQAVSISIANSITYGTQAFLYFNGNGNSNDFECVACKIPTGEWTFVGYTYSSASGIVTMYVNGQTPGEAVVGTLNTASGSLSSIGAGGLWGNFPGSISNVQIYNTSISATQASQLYQEGVGGAPVLSANVAGWWPLNGNLNDYSGNRGNGQATNTVYSTVSNLYNTGIYTWR